MKAKMELKPIGIVYTPFKQAKGTPIQPVFSKDTEGIVEVFDEYTEGLKDLDDFERIWLIYWFDRSKDYKLNVMPYMDTESHGLFATRAPARPNPIGLSPVQLIRIENNRLIIGNVDILNGTPLLDIKPYASKFDCFNTTRNGWLDKVNPQNPTADDRFHK